MSHAIRSRVWRAGVAVVALALLPGMALSAGEQPAKGETKAQVKVRVIQDPATLQAVRSSELAEHLRLVAEELRLLTEARMLGTEAPELKTTEVKVFRTPSGMQKARLGVDQLHTAVVRFGADGPVAACVEGHQASKVTSSAVTTSAVSAPEWEEQ